MKEGSKVKMEGRDKKKQMLEKRQCGQLPEPRRGGGGVQPHTSSLKTALMTFLLPSSHLHQPYWLATCNSKLITAYTLPYINHVLGLPAFFLNSCPLKMRQIGCPRTSVRNYHYSLHNNPEECSSHLLCGGSLKSTTNFFTFLHSDTFNSKKATLFLTLPYTQRT
jgi:hypothetical protein